MTIVRQNLNELADLMEKDPHGDFLRAKELLLIEINKYIKEKLNGVVEIITPEIEDLLKQSEYEPASIWKQALIHKHVDPIIEQLNLLRDELNKFHHVENVGDLDFKGEVPKETFKDKLKKINPRR
jgi:hypothetical protein